MNEDLKQYVTNLLYYSYAFNEENKKVESFEFDKWVEERVNEIDEYFKSEKS